MIDDIKFVRNAVATKDFVPELTFFRICDGRITGYNGELSISSPVSIDLDIAPSASHFMKAINACEETITLKMKKERLEIRSGKFKSFVNCIDVKDVPTLVPSGEKVIPQNSIVEAFKTLEPFIAIDASKPWACGVLLRGQSAFATNNVTIVESWIGSDLPTINIPSYAIKEVIKYKQEPEHLLIKEDRIFFCYEGGRWISSPLLSTEWPNIERVLNMPCGELQEFPQGFFEGISKLVKFGDNLNRCFFKDGMLATSKNDDVEGATVECEGVPEEGIFNLNQLLALKGVAQQISLQDWPKPMMFVGDKLRGVIVGYRA